MTVAIFAAAMIALGLMLIFGFWPASLILGGTALLLWIGNRR